jgi:hypothetical protein
MSLLRVIIFDDSIQSSSFFINSNSSSDIWNLENEKNWSNLIISSTIFTDLIFTMFYQSLLSSIFDLDQKKSFDLCMTLCIQDHYIDNAQSRMKLKMYHSNIECNFVSKFEWMNLKHLNVNIQTIYLRCSSYLYEEHLFMLTIISWQSIFSNQKNKC